ncbi:hypothetical protein [Methylococcus sp. BF19-07]
MDSLTHALDGHDDALLFGTNVIYGAVHQFGAEQAKFADPLG